MPQITAALIDSNKNDIVIYHAHCMDGMGAAYAAFTVLGDKADYLAAAYDDPLPDVDLFRLKDVYIVDFSYPADYIRKLGMVAATVTVLDHHASAQKDLVDQEFPKGVTVQFDMKRSGAGMTWDFFHGTAETGGIRNRLTLINYIEDRDLWRWALYRSKEINAYIALHDLKLGTFHDLAKVLDDSAGFVNASTSGELLLKQQDKIVSSICKKAFEKSLWSPAGTKKVMFVNTSTMISEVGNMLLEKNPHIDFVAGWMDIGDGPQAAPDGVKRVWSLRAAGKFDCSVLAKKFGGGGHPNAAGFTSSMGLMLSELP